MIANAWVVYSRLFTYVRRYWPALIIAMVASMVYSGIDAWFVSFLKPLLNKGLVKKDPHFLKWAPLLVLVAFVLRGTASFFSNYNIASVSRNVIMRLRQDMFAHLQKLPASFYDHSTSGQIISVVLYSVEQVANASADVLTTAIQSVFLVCGLLFVMFSISWKLSLMYFIIIPLITVIMRFTSLRVRRLSLSIQNSVADLTHCTEESVEGYKVIRAFGGQEYEINKFDKAARINRQREMKIVAARSWSVSSVQLVAAIALSITFYIATLDISGSLLSPGGFVAMVAAMLALLKPMKDLTSMQNKLYRGLAGAQTVFELLDQKPEDDSGTRTLQRAEGKIEFSHVGFSYEAEKIVLKDISVKVNPGETVALVGRSGSGKSTLVSLLPRFYAHYTGEIFLDEHSIREYKLADLRHQFAFVSQHVTLFNDTVYNNIAYGRFDDVSEEEVRAAAKAAYALDFIEQLPKGLNTLVGENGVLLSGGQRQRIAIARAILKNAPILILDEATSALDTESERYIQVALEELMRNRTTLVIAHRLSTIEHADNLWARRGTQAPLLVFAGHTDVVPPGPLADWTSPPFEPREHNGYLYGRGAADMKSGLAAMIIAAENFIIRNPEFEGSIGFLITSDEEGPSINGTKKVIEVLESRNEKIDYCIIGEATANAFLGDQIRVGRRGSLGGKLTIYGKQGHVAFPHLAKNPIHLAAKALYELTTEVWDEGNEFFPPTTFQISNIHAGTGAGNVIPGTLEITFNLRFSTAITVEEIQQRVAKILENSALNFDMQWDLSGLPFLTKKGKLLTAVQSSIKELTDLEPILSTGGGTSDGRFIAPTGAEVIELGPCNATVHQVNENIRITDLDLLMQIYKRALEKIF